MSHRTVDYETLLREVLPIHLLEGPVRDSVEESIDSGGKEGLWRAASLALESLAARGFFAAEAPSEKDGSVTYHDRRGLLTVTLHPLERPRPDYEFPFRPLLSAEFASPEQRKALETVLTGVATRSTEDELGDSLRKIVEYLHASLDPARVRFLSAGEEEAPGGIFEPGGSSLLARIYREHFQAGGGPIYIPDLLDDDRFSTLAETGEVRSAALLPLRAAEETFGLLEVHHRAPDAFDEKRLGVLSLLALLAAGRIRNALHLEKLIYVDLLTGVFSRRFFEEQILREVERANRDGSPLAMVMVDLDNFKEVNDRFGHLAGDGVLSRVAEILRGHVRKIDLVTRYGGEEFAILLPGASRSQTEVICERLRALVEALPVPEEGDARFALTTSIGVALYPEHTPESLGPPEARKELLARADQALYTAKNSGKNQVVFYGENGRNTGPRPTVDPAPKPPSSAS
ncbi:MAG: sensor domain-containing diguanylate cyclase [Candidatus Eisenbacteria bacterium]